MQTILLASGNPDKLLELQQLCKNSDVEVIAISEILPDWDVEETGVTLLENALLKASSASAEAGMPCIADDTGLFVDVLGGAPGVYSARFAGTACTYDDNVRKLLRNMYGESNRNAEFRTSAVYVDSSGTKVMASGEVKGRITLKPVGSHGFGYDPVFYSVELKKTFAECSAEEKNNISHRAQAITLLIEELKVKSLIV